LQARTQKLPDIVESTPIVEEKKIEKPVEKSPEKPI